MRRFISPSIKIKVERLRRQQHSLGFIAKELHVAKSTIYEWLKTMEGAERYALLGRERWLRDLQHLGALGQRRKRERKINQII